MKSVIMSGLILMICSTFAFATGLDGIKFIKISAYDQKAVIKTAAGEMKVVAVGDEIKPNTTLVEIAENQVMLETIGANGPEKLIVHLDQNGKQKIDRMGSVPVDSNKLRPN
jgi:hypothetical protein